MSRFLWLLAGAIGGGLAALVTSAGSKTKTKAKAPKAEEYSPESSRSFRCWSFFLHEFLKPSCMRLFSFLKKRLIKGMEITPGFFFYQMRAPVLNYFGQYFWDLKP